MSPPNQSKRLDGVFFILIATAVAGVASYAVLTLVFRGLDPSMYVVFAAFWSFLYLIVGTLGGVQQEVARGTRVVSPSLNARENRSRNIAVVGALATFAVIIGTAPFWVAAAFPDQSWALVFPLAVGASTFVLVSVLGGTLYGVGGWKALGFMIGSDGVLRLIAVGAALIFTDNVVVLAWAVVCPFVLTIPILWPLIRRSMVGNRDLDASYSSVVWNVFRTMTAAAAMGIMVSGYPLILQLTSVGEPGSLVGLYVFCITLARAPLIILMMSLQSYLVVTFRDLPQAFWRFWLKIQGGLFGVGITLAAFLAWLGPTLFENIFPGRSTPGGTFLGLLVLSSVLVGSMCVSAPALLARGHHVAYAAGWVAGALGTVVLLIIPIDFTTRVVISLLVGPVAGIVVQVAYLVRSRVDSGKKRTKGPA